MATIYGTLPMTHDVDASGSFTLNVPLSIPESRFKPAFSAFYHSASTKVSVLGKGWILLGISVIERVPATIAQDTFRGVVSYDNKDRFALDGQRLIQIGDTTDSKTEYRFEVEQWARVFALGDDLANPTSWEQHLPDGTIRQFGNTEDSNVKAEGHKDNYTRVWAIAEASDPFTNYITFQYTKATGAFRPTRIAYGGNRKLTLQHQRHVWFHYQGRLDITTEYLGGCKIRTGQRLIGIRCFVGEIPQWHQYKWGYEFDFNYAPLTGLSRVRTITLYPYDSQRKLNVQPLTFDWNDGNLQVFDPIQDVTVLSPSSFADVIRMDVDAKGFSDMVFASKRSNPTSEKDELYLEIYLSDSEGNLSDTPTKGSGFTGLPYPEERFHPIDADGDGQTDLLYISSSESTYSIRILSSTEDTIDVSNKFNKFVPQAETVFTSGTTEGTFHTGDFEGNGKIGLLYIYTTATTTPDTKQLSFVQFTSDGTQLTAKPAENGPLIKSKAGPGTKDDFRVIVGDLTGNGVDDVFILNPETSDPATSDPETSDSTSAWKIYLLSSDAGALKYQTDDPLQAAGSAVTQVLDVVILPFKADGDGKTGLLFASKAANDFLQFQLLRSIGNSLLPDTSPTVTTVKYEGNVTIARLIQNTSEVVNIGTKDGQPTLSVFKFDGEKFQQIPNVAQPTGVGEAYDFRCADLRGIGRSDLVFNTLEDDGRITVRALLCSGSQPLDYITTARNGIGGFTTVGYAPLTNPNVYTASEVKYRQPTALMNGVANNSTSTLALTGTGPVQVTESTRSTLVYFPSFVVRNISSKYGSGTPVFVNQFTYTYSNAEISFDGRGWLGFQTITKVDKTAKITESTEYLQTFPLIGQVKLFQKMDSEDSTRLVDLQKAEYTWTPKQVNNGKNHTTHLDALKETYYEGGVKAYDVDVTYTYDDYDNILSTTIASSQPTASALSIGATYDAPNTDTRWVVGNKRTEDVKQGDTFLRRLSQDYTADTFVCKEKSHWVRESTWSTTNYAFNDAGYQKEIKGPSSYHQEFSYDSMYTIITTKTQTGTKTIPDETTDEPVTVPTTLDETTTYDPATSLPLIMEKPNGVVTKFQYDVLGRTIAISQGPDKTDVSEIETTTFSMDGSKFVQTRQISNGLIDKDAAMRSEITYYDGFMRSLSVRKSRPDNLAEFICVDTGYDSLDRMISRSKEYLSTASQPPGLDQQFQYTYDKNSRLSTEVYPPNKSGGKSVTHRLEYSCEGAVPKISEILSVPPPDDGTADDTGRITRELAIIPNADDPSVGNFVKLCVAKRQNEKLQTINTTYDGLARPIEVTDSSARVKLVLKYDGLSRQVEREIIQLAKPGDGETGGDGVKMEVDEQLDHDGIQADIDDADGDEPPSDVTFSHFRLTFDDVNLSSTLLNVLANTSITSKTDFCRRLLEKSTTEETLTFKYDAAKTSQGRLSSVASNKGIEHNFLYDNRGNHTSTTLNIDSRVLQTTFTWTETGQLKTTSNPDGTSISQDYCPDGLTTRSISLSKGDAVKASVSFSGLNEFGLPLIRTFGNQITSTTTVSDSGMLSGDTLTLAGTETPLLVQQWEYDAFNKVTSHKIGDDTSTYGYDNAGQLSQSIIGKTTTVYQDGLCLSATQDSVPTEFTNNIDGWQLKSVLNAADKTILYEYTYSNDGKTSTKKAGDVTTTLDYDTQDRLKAIVGDTDFIYDYMGRLLKVTAANGDSVLYVSPGCEMKVKKDATTDPTTTTTTWTSYLIDNERRASYSEDQPPPSAEDTDAEASGVVYYFHTDQLGSTVAVSDSAGVIVTHYSYDALGKVTISGEDVARYKYCGKERFGTLYNFGARFYDFETGRFMTLDSYPIDVDNISPGSFNLYGFSQNDPINFIDVNGNHPVPTYHWIVDGLLTLAGLGLTIASIVTLNPLLAIAGGALLNSGVSGFITDVAASSDNSSDTGTWLFQLGLGAVIGAVFGAASIGLGLGIRHGSKALLSVASRQIFKHAILKNSFSLLAEAGLGAAAGATQQVLTNAYAGDPLGKDVGWSAALGAIAGFLAVGGLKVGQSKWTRTALAGQASERLITARTGLPNLRMQLAQGRFVNSSVVRNAPVEIYYVSKAIHLSSGKGFTYIDA